MSYTMQDLMEDRERFEKINHCRLAGTTMEDIYAYANKCGIMSLTVEDTMDTFKDIVFSYHGLLWRFRLDKRNGYLTEVFAKPYDNSGEGKVLLDVEFHKVVIAIFTREEDTSDDKAEWRPLTSDELNEDPGALTALENLNEIDKLDKVADFRHMSYADYVAKLVTSEDIAKGDVTLSIHPYCNGTIHVVTFDYRTGDRICMEYDEKTMKLHRWFIENYTDEEYTVSKIEYTDNDDEEG